MVGEADLLVEPFATLVAGVGPHAAGGEAKTNRTLNSHLAAVFRSIMPLPSITQSCT